MNGLSFKARASSLPWNVAFPVIKKSLAFLWKFGVDRWWASWPNTRRWCKNTCSTYKSLKTVAVRLSRFILKVYYRNFRRGILWDLELGEVQHQVKHLKWRWRAFGIAPCKESRPILDSGFQVLDSRSLWVELDRRAHLCLKVWHNIKNNPDGQLHRLLPPVRSECHSYHLRNSSSSSRFQYRTKRFGSSFFPAMAKIN